jgi:hypothetical protein
MFEDADLRGRRLAQYMWSELEKIAQGTGPVQQQGEQQSGALEGAVQREVEGDEEASPAHGIVASRVEQLSDKKARGVPVLEPPPGMVYAPELQAFVPDPNNPGWMQAEQAAEAAKAQTFYQQGQADLQAQQAQAELDQKATVEAQQMAAQGAAQEQQQMAEMAAQQQAPQAQMQAEAREMAKQKAKSVAGGLQTPGDIMGGEQEPKRSKPATKKPDQKGVTIKIGK